MTILLADDLFRFYHPGEAEVRALRGASLQVDRGETAALVGPSGSGKSTLLACIAGLDEPDGGTVTIDGHRMTRRPEAERAALRAASIGFLAQSGNLFTHLSVADNIGLQMDLCGRRRDRARISALLQLVGLTDRADALPAALSGGEAARAGLAVALANDPALLIADEPTAEVDAETEARILDILEARRAAGCAALIATHSIGLSARASRVVAMMDGRIVEARSSNDLAANTASAATSVIGAQDHVERVPHPKGGTIMIETHDVSRRFGPVDNYVDSLCPTTLSLYAGQRVALMGPSGSGKSTLLNLLAGLEDPSAGTIAWPGLDNSRPLRPRQIGFVFQSASLLASLTVLENMRLPIDIAGADRGDTLDPLELLERFSLSDLAGKLPDQLSGGQIQRVALARALVMRPAVLLADEPTGQIDHATGQAVMRVMLELIQDSGAAVLIATHDPSIAAFMDAHWGLVAGRLVLDDTGKAAA
jgi:ABC-type lipoprotein export system ATPase subunit